MVIGHAFSEHYICEYFIHKTKDIQERIVGDTRQTNQDMWRSY